MASRTNITGNTGVTRYLQLYTTLSQALSDGRIVPGGILPSEPELVRQYKVSRTTVRRALDRLEEEDRIVRRRGSGTYARLREPRPLLRLDRGTLLADLHLLAERTRSTLLTFERINTPAFVRRLLPEFALKTLFVRALREFEGEPLMVSSSYVPEPIGGRLNKRVLGTQPLVTRLHKVGVKPIRSEQSCTAVSADVVMGRHLKVGVGSPLLYVKQTIRDSRGRCVAHEELHFRPERYELYMEIDVR